MNRKIVVFLFFLTSFITHPLMYYIQKISTFVPKNHLLIKKLKISDFFLLKKSNFQLVGKYRFLSAKKYRETIFLFPSKSKLMLYEIKIQIKLFQLR
jgi:hypothetical protein